MDILFESPLEVDDVWELEVCIEGLYIFTKTWLTYVMKMFDLNGFFSFCDGL